MSESTQDHYDPSELIRFFTEDLVHKPEIPDSLDDWLVQCAKKEAKCIYSINIIFCSDNYLFELNSKYLGEENLTDVIAFHYSSNPIEGEIYISWDRIKENAVLYSNNDHFKELVRVVVHGFLHLCGYSDKKDPAKTLMHAKENTYLKEYLRSYI